VEVLADAARAINPSAAVQAVPASVLDVDPALLAMADVVVCATDGHGSRALLTELAQQYLVPVVDLGVEVVPGARGAGGGVRVLRPGGWCLHCAGTLDAGLVREEYLDDQERARELERGYLRGANVPAPAVISLNGVVASLAALEICQLLVGFLGNGGGRLLYRVEARALTTASVARHGPELPRCSPAELVDLVLDEGPSGDELVGLATEEGLGEAFGLLELDLAGERGLVGVDDAVDQGRAIAVEGGPHGGLQLTGLLDPDPGCAAGLGDLGEVDAVVVADPVLGVAEDDLLPLDLAEGGVVVDDHGDR
jgi:molybdopterin/thiamine biosynthesis adenylyltransferase